MKKLIIAIIYLNLFIVSCDKDDTINDASSSSVQTTITKLKYSEGKIHIDWLPTIKEGFAYYEVYKYVSHYKQPNISMAKILSHGNPIHTQNSRGKCSYTDKDIEKGVCIYYAIKTTYHSDSDYIKTYPSINFKVYERPELLFEAKAEYVGEGNKIRISWDKTEAPNFISYNVYRYKTFNEDIESEDIVYFGEIIGSTYHENACTFIDHDVNLQCNGFSYAVRLNVSGNYSHSQTAALVKNNLHFDCQISEVFTNPLNNHLMLISKTGKKLIEYSTDTRTHTRTINFDEEIQAYYLSEKDGNYELLLPADNGTVYVYNLADFSKLDEIKLTTENPITSLIVKDEVIFYIEKFYGHIEGRAVHKTTHNPIWINNLNTKMSYFHSNNEVKLINGPDHYAIAMTKNTYRSYMLSIIYDGKNIILKQASNGTGYEYINADILYVTDDLNTFITGEKGKQFKLNYQVVDDQSNENCFHFEGNYKQTDKKYKDVDFHSDKVYFVSCHSKEIFQYNYNNFTNKKMIPIRLEPGKIECINNKLIHLKTYDNVAHIEFIEI